MKKQQEKRLIIRELTESQIKEIAVSKWMRKNILWIVLWCVAWLVGWFALIHYIEVIQEQIYLQMIVLILAVSNITLPVVWKMSRVGKKIWNEIKDKDQPIRI